jgi:hypothetical protein
VLTLYYPLKTSLYCVQFSFGNPCFFSALVQVRVTCVSLVKFASHLILVVVILSMLSLSLILRVHAAIDLSLSFISVSVRCACIRGVFVAWTLFFCIWNKSLAVRTSQFDMSFHLSLFCTLCVMSCIGTIGPSFL